MYLLSKGKVFVFIILKNRLSGRDYRLKCLSTFSAISKTDFKVARVIWHKWLTYTKLYP